MYFRPTLTQVKKVFEIAQEEGADITWGYGIFQRSENIVLEFAFPQLDARKHNFLSEEAIDAFFIHRFIISPEGEVTRETENQIPKTTYKARTKDYEDVVRLEEPEDIKRCIFCDKEDMRKNFWSSRFCSEEHEKLQKAKWKERDKEITKFSKGFKKLDPQPETYEIDLEDD